MIRNAFLGSHMSVGYVLINVEPGSESSVCHAATSLGCVTDANLLFGDYDLIVKVEGDDMGDIAGKRVLVREDLNVPMQDGSVTDDTRLRAAMPTVLELADRGAKVLILAHFGRPKGQKNPEFSLSKITRPLTQVLGREVQFIPDCQGEAAVDGIKVMRNGDIAILENTRFHAGEEKNDPALVDAIAAIGDLYVNDAFSAAHRAHASTEGLARKMPLTAIAQSEQVYCPLPSMDQN